MKPIKSQLIHTIVDYNLLQRGDRVTVALSGGADSVALLLLLLEIRAEWRLTVAAAHLDHGLRGEESARDAAFVASLCKKLEVPFSVAYADVAACQKPHEGLEAAARRERYAFLRQAAAGGKIATAHTADDQVETVLLNLTRGAGLDGLRGIPVQRGQIIRPLLFVSGEMTRQYLQKLGQPYMVDSTNLSDCYTRNRIRHHVVPKLREMNPRLSVTVGETCRYLANDAALLDQLAADALEEAKTLPGQPAGLRLKVLLTLHPALLSRVLRLYFGRKGCQLSALHTRELETLVLEGDGSRGLSAGYTAILSRGVLRLVTDRGQMEFSLDFSGLSACFQGRILRGVRQKAGNVHNLLSKNKLDYAKIGKNLIVRSRLPGDAYRPAGRHCTKTLKKLFQEAGIPVEERVFVPILADENGILWVEGFGPDERVAVTPETREILLLKL